ncbi:MAG: ABC transporter permease [Desulfobulbaceae bacterium]|jgi:ABC-2 type transport system permease protein|nr:ABC transporter permease [Desulfobulbaceae bacterium]
MTPATFMRLRGFVRKEWLQIVRDPSSIGIAFVLPVLLLLVFGYGVSLDARDIPLAIVVEHPGPEADSFTAGFYRSPYFVPLPMPTIQEAEQAMREAKVDGIVWLRENFDRGYLQQREPPINIIINGLDANTARLVEGYVQGVWAGWLERQAEEAGRAASVPVRLEQRIWYNPEVRSTDFLVPGIIAVVMTLIGALLTALIIAREWERGTMEAMLVTPVTVRDILAGKLLPYFFLGMGGFTLSTLMAVFLFDVPLRGSLWVLLAASSLFLLTALGMGLLISSVARSQFVAAQAAILVTFLPAFLLSGFIFDISSMPAVVQGITHLIAARYYVAILQTLFLVGDVWAVILPNMLALLAMALLFLGVVFKKTVKRLE